MHQHTNVKRRSGEQKKNLLKANNNKATDNGCMHLFKKNLTKTLFFCGFVAFLILFMICSFYFVNLESNQGTERKPQGFKTTGKFLDGNPDLANSIRISGDRQKVEFYGAHGGQVTFDSSPMKFQIVKANPNAFLEIGIIVEGENSDGGFDESYILVKDSGEVFQKMHTEESGPKRLEMQTAPMNQGDKVEFDLQETVFTIKVGDDSVVRVRVNEYFRSRIRREECKVVIRVQPTVLDREFDEYVIELFD